MIDPSSILSTSDEGDDFDAVTLGQRIEAVARAGHDFQIALDSDLAPVQPEGMHQIGDKTARWHVSRLTIDCQLQHGFRSLRL
tara:strand:- start:19317 stop:19565 length:249 start_codon:yes stop_codon:yes gene_type:complete